MFRIVSLLVFLFLSIGSKAFIISGKITDHKGNALPFATVHIKGTTNGTTANGEGSYTLYLPKGKYELDFRNIGYKLLSEAIEIKDKDLTLNVTLLPESMELKEVTIKASDEDPAYRIIREAIKKRKYYNEQTESYSCDVYIKGLQRIKKFPKKILGQELSAQMLDIIDSSGIIYLSESVSKFNFKRPDQIRETMIASKTSGDSKGFSYNQASQMIFNLYDNLIINQLTSRGFVSPISSTALLYYKYNLIGSFNEGGITVNKIKVTPLRKVSPAFSGFIYIQEGSWRVHSAELQLTKDAGVSFVDTLWFTQINAPVNDSVWMPVSNKFDFTFTILGLNGSGTYLSSVSNYNTNPSFPAGFFSNEIISISDTANKKNNSYWDKYRPVPLTKDESKDYTKRDSLESIHHSKPYLDSLDAKTNKFNWMNVFFGYNYDKSFYKTSIGISAPLEDIQFNTVEGFNPNLKLHYTKEFGNEKKFSIEPALRYGFSNKHFNGSVKYSLDYNPKKFAKFSIEGGSSVSQFNSKNPVSPLVNSLYTLLNEQNFLKIYEKRFFNIYHYSELYNGVSLRMEAEYADRRPLTNTTNFTYFNKVNREFTSNEPFPGLITTHTKALTLTAGLRIKFGQQYMSRPDEKVILGSKYPAIFFNYTKAIKGALGSDIDYDFVKIGIEDHVKIGLFGTTRYKIATGSFLSKRSISFIDYNHFTGNQTIVSDFILDRFEALPYYQYSSGSRFMEGHLEHNFAGFILNKFPLLNKLRLQEIIGVHYLTTPDIKQYIEFTVGVQRGMVPFKIEFVTSFADKKRVANGFRIAIPFGF